MTITLSGVSLSRTIIVPLVMPARSTLRFPNKDPNETLDFSLDMTNYVSETGDSVTSFSTNVTSATTPALVAADQAISSDTPALLTAVISGGLIANDYPVIFAITMASGLVIVRTVWLAVLPITYEYQGTVFTNVAPGQVGPQGNQGPPGDGTPGTIWWLGSGAPGTVVGAIANDLYLDTVAGNFYKYTGDPLAWVEQGSLKGPTGATGASGAAINTLPDATTCASSDSLAAIIGGNAEQIPISDFFDATGTGITNLSAAAAPSATDTFPVLQGGTLLLQNEAAQAAFVLGRFGEYFYGTLELQASTVLDPSAHNRVILVASVPCTISKPTVYSGTGFTTQVWNRSSGFITFTSDFIVGQGVQWLAPNCKADVAALVYTGGSIYMADLDPPPPGLLVGAASYAVTTAQSVAVIGTINPATLAVQVQAGTSATVAPTGSWTNATVNGYGFTATISGLSAGTYYIWARETATTSITAVSGAVVVSSTSGSVTITSPPTTATEGQVLSLAGTVAPGGTAVQLQFGTSSTVAPTGSWTAATIGSSPNTAWTCSLTAPGTAGTFYIWAEQTGSPGIYTVSPAVTVSAPSAPAIASTIGGLSWTVSAPTSNTSAHYTGTTITVSCTFPFSGTPSGSAAPQLFWVQSPVSAIPTANGTTIIDTAVTNPIVGALINSGALDAYINPPPTAGTWYLTGWYNATQGFNTTAFIVT